MDHLMAAYDVPPPWAFELLRAVLVAGGISAAILVVAIAALAIRIAVCSRY